MTESDLDAELNAVGRAALDFFLVRFFVAAAAFEQIIERRHDAHADGVIVQRNVPPPALFVGRLDDEGGALVAARVAVGALPVGPDGALVQLGIRNSQAESIDDH